MATAGASATAGSSGCTSSAAGAVFFFAATFFTAGFFADGLAAFSASAGDVAVFAAGFRAVFFGLVICSASNDGSAGSVIGKWVVGY